MMFSLSSEPIPDQLGPPADSAGAVVVFEGRVRNTNEGREVVRLEYEAYVDLAVKDGSRILEASKSRFEIMEAFCVHRIGSLNPGELAIRVEVYAAHRRAAFEACAWIVDEVKRTVPIWKKEHYREGDSGWLANEVRQLDTDPGNQA